MVNRVGSSLLQYDLLKNKNSSPENYYILGNFKFYTHACTNSRKSSKNESV